MEKPTSLFIKVFVFVENIILAISYSLLTFMTLTTFTQVILRYFFNSGIRWVEELCTLCIVWYGFISIAFGTINKEHISINSATRWVPQKIRMYWDRFNYLLIGAYGAFMVVYGCQITAVVANQTLPATKWSSSIVYAAIPFGGILLVIFSLMVATGFVVRHPEVTCLEEKIDWEAD